jgi:hypothetical protein
LSEAADMVIALSPAAGAGERRNPGVRAGGGRSGEGGLRVVVPHPVGEPGAILLKTSDVRLYNLILQMVYFLSDTSRQSGSQAAEDLTTEESLALARECLEEARHLLRGLDQEGTRRMLDAAIETLSHAAAA